MHKGNEDLTPVERARWAREDTEGRFKTMKGLCDYYRRIEKKQIRVDPDCTGKCT